MPVPQDQPAKQPAGQSVDLPVGPPVSEPLTWTQDGETFTLVIEPLDTRPFTRADNAVVYRSDGSRRCRVRPPRELMSNPAAVLGFFHSFPGPDGRPVLVLATRSSGDFQGTLDLETGTLRSLVTWR
ncbi:hypothetical protein [Streptomyces sp. NBC_00503]|uniref:hypothetical protein n=1 Tax=Streptomyces sp. NBC_00503 TaxID=2903659 RepID=UPI002E8132EB|nr:hypothetical protein [Streptomyces sp. NBC_00503]WUD82470.1 hypothetical protein OG490_19080 [Streptomyces sp. NBC_00503]